LPGFKQKMAPRKKTIQEVGKDKSVYKQAESCRDRILVADDMVYAIVAMRAILLDVFYLDSEVVTYVKDGYEAVDEIRKNLACVEEPGYRPFTLLILDFNMPFLDGLQVVD